MTLIEVLVAFFILSLVIGSTFAALGQGLSLSTSSRLSAASNEILQREMEYLRTLNWAELDDLAASASFHTVPGDPRIQTTRIVTDRAVDQKIIRLIVVWTDKNGKQHEVSAVTLITRNGITA